MSCSLTEPVQGPGAPTASEGLVVWLRRLMRGFGVPASLRVCCVWGGALVFLALLPSVVDCLEERSEIVERGKMTMAWLFRGNLLKKAVLASLAINVVLAGMFLAVRRQAPKPLLALILLHLLMLASVRSMSINHQFRVERSCGADTERQWQHLRRLTIVEGFSPTLYHFDAQTVPVDSIQNFQQLHQWIATQYAGRRESLKKELGSADEDRLKTIFFMHFLADLWSFGNKTAAHKPGGVLENEENDWQAPHKISAQTFVQARIGCCADIAYVLKVLLDREGIPNRLTSIPGHVFNEVKLDGKWRIVDGTTNMLVDCAWDELFGADGQPSAEVRVHLFPDPRVGHPAGEEYRPITAQFRIQMLLRMAATPSAFQDVNHPELPAYFKAENDF
jgi:hypothetical protein